MHERGDTAVMLGKFWFAHKELATLHRPTNERQLFADQEEIGQVSLSQVFDHWLILLQAVFTAGRISAAVTS
jgi:hypothetical protein